MTYEIDTEDDYQNAKASLERVFQSLFDNLN